MNERLCRTQAEFVDPMVAKYAEAFGHADADDLAHTRWHAERMMAKLFEAAVRDDVIQVNPGCLAHVDEPCYVFTHNLDRPDGLDWFVANSYLLSVDDYIDESECPWASEPEWVWV